METSSTLAPRLEPLRRLFDALVHGGFGANLLETFLDDTDLQSLDSQTERLGVVLHLRRFDPRIVAVVARQHLEQQCVVRDVCGHRPGVIDEDLDRHDAGIGHEAPGRFHAVDAAEG